MFAARTTDFWQLRHLSRRPAAFFTALVVFIIVILVAAPDAQEPPAFAPETAAAAMTVIDASTATDIDLLVGRSTVLNVGSTIARVSLTVPDIADAMVTAPQQLLVHGKQPGTISLFVWDKAGAIKTFEVNVRRDLTALVEYLKQLFPGEPISVLGSGKDVVISGTVSSKYVIEKAADVAAGYVDKKENVVNLLKQQEGVASNQVMLRVRFAEVSRSALQELGASFTANGFKDDWFGRTTTQQFAAPEWNEDGKLVFSDFLNLFVFNAKEGLTGVVRALQNKGLFQSLAEPNLIATNGKEASFLAGGEYPYPVVQPSSGGNAVTIMFKEFGIRLNFTPTVLGGDLINLKVRPEVSALDFSNAITLEGFRVPALSTRRTETEVELRDGQTFAIAGLMNNTLNSSLSKIPGIGDIPVLGLLFRSKAHQKNQTELVVMITPTIIKKGQMGVSEGLPSLVEPYMGRPDHARPNPAPYVGSPRYPVDQPSSGSSTEAAPATAPRANAPAAPTSSRPVTAQPQSQATKPAPVSKQPAKEPTPKPAAMQTPATAAPPSESTDVTPAVTTAPAALQPPTAMQAPAGPPPMPPVPQAGPSARPTPPGMPGSVPAPQAAPAAAPAASAAQPATATKDPQKPIEKAKEQEKRAAEAEARERAASAQKRAEEQKAAQKKAEAEKQQAEKLAKERAEREAEIAKKNQEIARKQAEQDQKREKALTEAAARLKLAQTAYESELNKAKGGTDDKTKGTTGSSTPKQ
jgi:pilus assembly protein CpaC